jgi:hypothetical protein
MRGGIHEGGNNTKRGQYTKGGNRGEYLRGGNDGRGEYLRGGMMEGERTLDGDYFRRIHEKEK